MKIACLQGICRGPGFPEAFNTKLSSNGEHLFITIVEHFTSECMYNYNNGEILFTAAEGFIMELYIIVIIAGFIVY